MNQLKVKDHQDLIRDVSSSAILNINTHELQKHRNRKKAISDKNSQIIELSNRVESLENLVNKLLNNYNKE